MQEDVTVSNDVVSGTLKFIEGGLSPAGPLEGDGYFLAIKWSDPAQTVTSLKVGLVPSISGMEPIECLADTDRNGVFKITDPNNQVIKIYQSNADHKHLQILSLKGLILEEPAEG